MTAPIRGLLDLLSPGSRTMRRGAASAEAIGSTAGGGLGAAYGGLTGETPEERATRAAAFGAAGAGLGYGAVRGVRKAATPRPVTQAPGAAAAPGSVPKPGLATPEEIRQATRNVAEALRQTTPKLEMPSTLKPLKAMPENRKPLLQRMDLTPSERMLVEERIKQIEPSIARPFSEEQYRARVAQVMQAKSVPELAAIDARRATPEEAGAVLNIVRDMRKRISEKSAAMASAAEDEAARLADDIDALEETGTRLLSQLLKMDTAAGRNLAARRYMARDIKDPTYWFLKASRIKGAEALTTAEQATIDQLAREADRTKLLQYLASLQKASVPEQIAQLRSAGLLTAIPGRLRDLISTSVNFVSTTAQRYPGSLVDVAASQVASKIRGGDAQAYRSLAAPTGDEWSASLRGVGEGMRSAAQMMGYDAAKAGGLQGWVDFIRRAEIDPDMAARLDVPSLINIDMLGKSRAGQAGNTFLDVYSKGVMRASGVTDRILRTVAQNGAMVEQANLAATRRGLTGEARDTFVKEALASPTDEMLLNAKMAADYVTFTNDGTISDAIAQTINTVAGIAGRNYPGKDALVRAGFRLIIPFRRTPANILTRALEYAPGSGQIMLADAARQWHKALVETAVNDAAATAAIAKQQRRMVELFTKQATGLGMFGLGAYLYQQGLLTGETPENPAEQEQWRLEGKQPESLKIGDQWIPIARVSPYGGMMTMAASVLQQAQAKPESGVDALAGMTGTMTRSLLNQPMVTGPKELLEAATGRNMAGETVGRYAASMAGSFVPTGVAQAARAEGVQRLPQTLAQQVTSRIPGLQETAPMRLNIFGEPVQKAKGVTNVMLNPLPFTRDVRSTDPLVRELSRTGVAIGAMGRKKGEDFATYQYRQREAGQWVRQDLEALVQSEAYQQASVTQQRTLIRESVNRSRREFAAWLKQNYQMEDDGA